MKVGRVCLSHENGPYVALFSFPGWNMVEFKKFIFSI